MRFAYELVCFGALSLSTTAFHVPAQSDMNSDTTTSTIMPNSADGKTSDWTTLPPATTVADDSQPGDQEQKETLNELVPTSVSNEYAEVADESTGSIDLERGFETTSDVSEVLDVPDMAVTTESHMQATTVTDEIPTVFVSRVYRNRELAEKPLLTRPEGFEGRNTFDLFEFGANRPGIRHRASFGIFQPNSNGFEWLSYADLDSRSKKLGTGIVNLRLHGPVEDSQGHLWNMMGVFMENRFTWLKLEMACARNNITMVPIYETGDPSFVSAVLEQTKVKTVMAPLKKAKLLLNLFVAGTIHHLTTIVLVGTVFDKVEVEKEFPHNKVKILLIDEVELAGFPESEIPLNHEERPNEGDINTICFTSGTTGVPKGGMITHGNLLAVVAAATKIPNINMSFKDVHFAFLPPAHIFERIVSLAFVFNGGKIGYYSGDLKEMGRDIALVRPTILVGVPRVFEKTLEKIIKKMDNASGVAKMITNAAVTNMQQKKFGIRTYFVHSKLMRVFGGRLRAILSGGARLNPMVQKKLQDLLQIPIIEGYGMTETTGGTLIAAPTLTLDGVTSQPQHPTACVELRLRDVDLHTAIHKVYAGELEVRGPSVFAGYFDNPEETAAIFNSDGFVKTGDVAELVLNEKQDKINPLGFRIISRSKEIYKLENGEYVTPSRIELVYKSICKKMIEDMLVEPSVDRKYNVGIVAVTQNALDSFQLKENDNEAAVADISDETLNNPNHPLLPVIGACMENAAKRGKLATHETVKSFYLTGLSFGNPDNGFVTPTLKLKRAELRQKYEEALKQL